MTDKYAVIGSPIEHSMSPLIHAEFAKQTNQNISYEAILAPLDGFVDTVNRLIAEGYQGINVTVPFKFAAYALATQLTSSATHAGAVNTLSFTQGSIFGHNTDGIGMVRDIEQNISRPLQGKRILLLGAGGAAEGVLHPMLDAGPSELVIANRSVDKAIAMIDKVIKLKQFGSIKLHATTFQGLESQQFDLVINATSTGLSKTVLPIPNVIFSEGCLAYDMMYGRETPFLAQAQSAGAQVSDGLGMLVEQAAEAFYLWRGVRPDSKRVIQKMRAL